MITFITTLASFSTLVAAHGFISEIIIDGKTYAGNPPTFAADTFPSIIRQISTVDPNYGAGNPALSCGNSARQATEIADVNPGSTIEFDWEGGDGSNWPHNTGPMFTYMASCGDTPCNQVDAKDVRWFKIEQVGRSAPGADWVQQELMNGKNAVVKIPETLAPGNYIIRHEIIALHLGTRRGGAEFYPQCANIRVGGSQTGRPQESELVSFPGAYSDDDRGIFFPQVYNTNAEYVFPGPPVAKFVSDPPNNAPAPSPSSPGNSPSVTPSSPPPSGSNAGQSSRPTSTGSASPSTVPTSPSTPGSLGSSRCHLKHKVDTPSSQTVLTKRGFVDRVLRGLNLGNKWPFTSS